MKHTAINVILFCGILGAMLCIQVVDNGHEHEAAKQELKRQRFEKAASEMCGNGSASVDADGVVTCVVRKALNSSKVKL